MELEWIADSQREYGISERDAMNAEIFEQAVRRLLPGADVTGAARWVEFARDNVSSEQYVGFEPVSFPVDERTEVGRWLGSFFAGLYQAAQTYGAETAEKLWECGLHHSCLYPYEMLPMAEHLQKGGAIEDVEKLIREGTLDVGSPVFARLRDILPTDSPDLERDPLDVERERWADERSHNKALLSHDLASGSLQLYALEKELQGQDGAFSEWLRAAYEINEDFEQPLAEVINEICASLRDADHQYGRTIARRLYNTQAVILPAEIRNAAHFLSLGGQFESIGGLASVGFFMEEYGHGAMERVVQFMNAGGAADEAWRQTREEAPAQQVAGASPALPVQTDIKEENPMGQETSHVPNQMLGLAAQIRQHTCGMCRVGPGPYGFGVYNSPLTKVGMLVIAAPNPCGDAPVPPGTTECEVTVAGFSKSDERPLSREELIHMRESSDRVTGLVISTLLDLGEAPVKITMEEYNEAYGVLLDIDQHQDNGLKKDEAIRLSDLKWWEERTPQEIVDFQLYEDLLCMPFHEFHGAVEAVLGRPVWTHEFAVKGRLTAEYAAVKQARASGGPMPEVPISDVFRCLLQAMDGADGPSAAEPLDEGPQMRM